MQICNAKTFAGVSGEKMKASEVRDLRDDELRDKLDDMQKQLFANTICPMYVDDCGECWRDHSTNATTCFTGNVKVNHDLWVYGVNVHELLGQHECELASMRLLIAELTEELALLK